MSRRILLSILYSFVLSVPLYIYVIQYFQGISDLMSDYGTEAWGWFTIPGWLTFGSASITLIYPVVLFIIIYKALGRRKL